jgi:hypothetical protein
MNADDLTNVPVSCYRDGGSSFSALGGTWVALIELARKATSCAEAGFILTRSPPASEQPAST